MRRVDGRRTLAALGCSAALLLWVAVSFAADAAQRAVLGTLEVYRTVEVARGSGNWRRVPTGAPLVDGTRVRTGQESAAYLSFGKAGIIGLYPGGEVTVHKLDSGRVALEVTRGSIIFRLDPITGPELRTPGFSALSASGSAQGAARGRPAEGTLSVAANGRSTIENRRGKLLLRTQDGRAPLVVQPGQRVELAAGGEPVFRRVQAVGPEVEGEKKEHKGRLAGWLEWIKTHPLWAGAIGVAVIGGAAGGAAAAAAGGGGGGAVSRRRPPSASPFRPPAS